MDTPRPRIRMNATDVRVRLGEVLRRLEAEDVIIEKGGVPVARLTRYEPDDAWPQRPVRYDEPVETWPETGRRIMAEVDAIRAAYTATKAASATRTPTAGDWDRALAAIREGPGAIDGDEVIADTYRWRDEGAALNRFYALTEDGLITEVPDDRIEELLDRQRRLYQRDQQTRYVADRGDTTYEA